MSESSSTLRQLQAAYDHLARKPHPWPTHAVLGQHPVADHVAAIRAGDDPPSRRWSASPKARDGDATTLALWALLPALREEAWAFPPPAPPGPRRAPGLCYEAIRRADPGEPRLARRLVERAHGRWRRGPARYGCAAEASLEEAPLEAASARWWGGTDPVADHVLARLSLGELAAAAAAAIDARALSPEAWAMLLAARLGGAGSDELGAVYGLSASAVRAAVARATSQLRDCVA